jgi:hypothetical protein
VQNSLNTQAEDIFIHKIVQIAIKQFKEFILAKLWPSQEEQMNKHAMACQIVEAEFVHNMMLL